MVTERVWAPPHFEQRSHPRMDQRKPGAHRGIARGTVGTVGIRVLQWELLPGSPSSVNPMQGVGVRPEKRGW